MWTRVLRVGVGAYVVVPCRQRRVRDAAVHFLLDCCVMPPRASHVRTACLAQLAVNILIEFIQIAQVIMSPATMAFLYADVLALRSSASPCVIPLGTPRCTRVCVCACNFAYSSQCPTITPHLSAQLPEAPACAAAKFACMRVFVRESVWVRARVRACMHAGGRAPERAGVPRLPAPHAVRHPGRHDVRGGGGGKGPSPLPGALHGPPRLGRAPQAHVRARTRRAAATGFELRVCGVLLGAACPRMSAADAPCAHVPATVPPLVASESTNPRMLWVRAAARVRCAARRRRRMSATDAFASARPCAQPFLRVWHRNRPTRARHERVAAFGWNGACVFR
jgi:hypothetical protein